MKITLETDSEEIVELIPKIQAQLRKSYFEQLIKKISRSLQDQKSSSPIAEWRTQLKSPETL